MTMMKMMRLVDVSLSSFSLFTHSLHPHSHKMMTMMKTLQKRLKRKRQLAKTSCDHVTHTIGTIILHNIITSYACQQLKCLFG